MSENVTWDSIPSSGSNGGRSDFLKLETGNSYKIRPLFEPVKFFKYFHKHDDRLRTAICGKPDICPVKDKHPELKKPSLRFAAHVIDRDCGKVKILEAPQTVFRPIGASSEMTGKNPGGGQDGSDWYIKVSGKGLNTIYDVGMIGPSPLTSEEKSMVKQALLGEDGKIDKQKLQKLYKVNTPEEIEEKLFGEWKKKEDNTKDSTSTSTSTSNDDDTKEDFDNNW